MRATPGDLVSLKTGVSTGVTLLLSSSICLMSSSCEEAIVELRVRQHGRKSDKISQCFVGCEDVS